MGAAQRITRILWVIDADTRITHILWLIGTPQEITELASMSGTLSKLISAGFNLPQACTDFMNEILSVWHGREQVSCCQDMKMVPRGLEPRTLRLLAVRSDQLSYKSLHNFRTKNENVNYAGV